MAEKLNTDIHPTLQSFIDVAPYIQALVKDDITIGIYNNEKLIVNFPAKSFTLNVKPGDPLLEGDIIYQAIKENKNLALMLPANLFGVSLLAQAVPLHDEHGKVIGGVGVGQNIEKANALSEVATNLSTTVEEVTTTILDMATSVTQLADNMTIISKQSSEVNNSLKNIEEVAGVVKGIADQSNLLGLNAAIESARAGEHGRGFSVVAEEIRKMAAGSKNQVEEIQAITTNIKNIIENLNGHIQRTHLESDTQSASIEELTATMEEVNINVRNLAALAQENLNK